MKDVESAIGDICYFCNQASYWGAACEPCFSSLKNQYHTLKAEYRIAEKRTLRMSVLLCINNCGEIARTKGLCSSCHEIQYKKYGILI